MKELNKKLDKLINNGLLSPKAKETVLKRMSKEKPERLEILKDRLEFLENEAIKTRKEIEKLTKS